MQKLTLEMVVIGVLILLPVPSKAQFVPWSSRQGPSSLRSKADAKYQDMWTLSDWLETQRKVRLMDQWLAMNSSSNPFEFYLGGGVTKYERTVDKNGALQPVQEFNMAQGTFGAFASIIGLEANYTQAKDNYDQFEGQINLRLLGRSQQGTNLTGFYGVRKKTYDEKSFTTQKEVVQQNMAGGSLTLNITRFFGLKGTYKNYFKHKTKLDNEVDGKRVEGTAFIDFLFVRVSGTFFQEDENYKTQSGDLYKVKSRGILGGLELFF